MVENKDKRRSMTAASIKDISSSIHSQNRRKSTSALSVMNLLDNGFIELIPIDQVNSSKEAVAGSYFAQEPGNYVLIFGMYCRLLITLRFPVHNRVFDVFICLQTICFQEILQNYSVLQ